MIISPSHINQVSITWVNQWVINQARQWSNSGPISITIIGMLTNDYPFTSDFVFVCFLSFCIIFFRGQIFRNQIFFWHQIFQNQLIMTFFSRPNFLKPSIIWHKPQNPNVTLWSEKWWTRFVSIKKPEVNMKLEMTFSYKITIEKDKCNWRLGIYIDCVVGTGVATALRK